MKPLNPFLNRNKITNPREFFGRKNEIVWIILDELISENPALLPYLKHYPSTEAQHSLPKRNPHIILKNLLKEACQQGFRFVFFIDEFELLARNPKLREVRFLHYLRGISDNYALAFVTSSRRPLSEISYDADPHGSPFDNNFSQPLLLGLFPEQESTELINGILKQHNHDPCLFQMAEIE